MIKAIVKLFLFNVPFWVISGIMFYLGFTANENALTSDGYNARLFFFVMGTAFFVIPLAVSFGILIWVLIKKKQVDDLVAVGKPGTAKVLKLEDTGVQINNNPRVKLLLEISVPGYPTYRAQKTVTLPLINLSQVQPDSIIQVLVDPQQPQNEKRIGLLLK
jgi:hypothetical protein